MHINTNYWHNFLFKPINQKSDPSLKILFCLSILLISVYLFLTFNNFLLGEYIGEIFEDDTRVYVFWLQKFIEPNLLADDLIADYFQSVTPPGYTLLFRIFALLGIGPVIVANWLTVGLTILAAAYVFLLSVELLPVPVVGLISTIIFWLVSGPVSNTPRGFVYVLIPAFAYYLLRNSLILCLLTVALQALFYPLYIFIMLGILIVRLFEFRGGKLTFSRQRQDYILCFSGIGIAFVCLIPYIITSSEFAPSITREEARLLPEYAATGRTPYFYDSFIDQFILGWQSGVQPIRLFTPIKITWISLLLPFFISLPSLFPLVTKLKQRAAILLQAILVSIGMFILAHWVFLKLFLPNRYTRHTWQIVICVATSIAIAILLEAIFQWLKQTNLLSLTWKNLFATVVSIRLLSYLLLYPIYVKPTIAQPIYHIAEIENFLAQQPKDIQVASLEAIAADNIPTFAKRSVFVSWEYANPYHPKYYNQIRARAINLIEAYYTDSLPELQDFIQQHQIDFFVIRPSHFSLSFIKSNRWLKQWRKMRNKIYQRLEQGETPALQNLIETCSVFQSDDWSVVSSQCIITR